MYNNYGNMNPNMNGNMNPNMNGCMNQNMNGCMNQNMNQGKCCNGVMYCCKSSHLMN